jgi:hypothetical protein
VAGLIDCRSTQFKLWILHILSVLQSLYKHKINIFNLMLKHPSTHSSLSSRPVPTLIRKELGHKILTGTVSHKPLSCRYLNGDIACRRAVHVYICLEEFPVVVEIRCWSPRCPGTVVKIRCRQVWLQAWPATPRYVVPLAQEFCRSQSAS